ncbi:hypothetical protein [uncultured Polaribacter sp.]|uniref:hypothetical protein n=1 Tax=uncultured Polaribacter sp. TaxID=174711 RepID=UPI00345C5D0E
MTYNKCRKQFAIGIFINLEYWDIGKQKASLPNKENTNLNNKISLIYQKIKKAYNIVIFKNDFNEDNFTLVL